MIAKAVDCFPVKVQAFNVVGQGEMVLFLHWLLKKWDRSTGKFGILCKLLSLFVVRVVCTIVKVDSHGGSLLSCVEPA